MIDLELLKSLSEQRYLKQKEVEVINVDISFLLYDAFREIEKKFSDLLQDTSVRFKFNTDKSTLNPAENVWISIIKNIDKKKVEFLRFKIPFKDIDNVLEGNLENFLKYKTTDTNYKL